MLFSEKLLAAVESLLFVSAEPLPAGTLSQVLEIKEAEVIQLLEQLAGRYQGEGSGIQLLQVAGGYQICTRSEFADYIEKLYQPQVQALSRAALETLAIIAYKQPITRAEVEHIRGVKVDSVMGRLMERKLIREVGRKEGPGRPILYGTTGDFLRYFGLKDIEDLPAPEQFIADAAAAEAAATKQYD